MLIICVTKVALEMRDAVIHPICVGLIVFCDFIILRNRFMFKSDSVSYIVI